MTMFLVTIGLMFFCFCAVAGFIVVCICSWCVGVALVNSIKQGYSRWKFDRACRAYAKSLESKGKS